MESGGSDVIRNYAADPDSEFWAKCLADAPTIETGQQALYWDAFQELGTERQIGMSIGPIPLSKVWDWASHMDFTHSEARALVHVIRALDGEYLSIISQKNKSNTKQSRTVQ